MQDNRSFLSYWIYTRQWWIWRATEHRKNGNMDLWGHALRQVSRVNQTIVREFQWTCE